MKKINDINIFILDYKIIDIQQVLKHVKTSLFAINNTEYYLCLWMAKILIILFAALNIICLERLDFRKIIQLFSLIKIIIN